MGLSEGKPLRAEVERCDVAKHCRPIDRHDDSRFAGSAANAAEPDRMVADWQRDTPQSRQDVRQKSFQTLDDIKILSEKAPPHRYTQSVGRESFHTNVPEASSFQSFQTLPPDWASMVPDRASFQTVPGDTSYLTVPGDTSYQTVPGDSFSYSRASFVQMVPESSAFRRLPVKDSFAEAAQRGLVPVSEEPSNEKNQAQGRHQQQQQQPLSARGSKARPVLETLPTPARASARSSVASERISASVQAANACPYNSEAGVSRPDSHRCGARETVPLSGPVARGGSGRATPRGGSSGGGRNTPREASRAEGNTTARPPRAPVAGHAAASRQDVDTRSQRPRGRSRADGDCNNWVPRCSSHTPQCSLGVL